MPPVRLDIAAHRRRTHNNRALAVLAWATQHGRVPTLRETQQIIGHPDPNLAVRLRRECFKLAPQRGGGAPRRIPYPVPPRFKAQP